MYADDNLCHSVHYSFYVFAVSPGISCIRIEITCALPAHCCVITGSHRDMGSIMGSPSAHPLFHPYPGVTQLSRNNGQQSAGYSQSKAYVIRITSLYLHGLTYRFRKYSQHPGLSRITNNFYETSFRPEY